MGYDILAESVTSHLVNHGLKRFNYKQSEAPKYSPHQHTPFELAKKGNLGNSFF